MSIKFMRRAEAAQYLKNKCGMFTAGTLAKMACAGDGPAFRKVGHFPVYTPEDLDAWLAARTSPRLSSTSELVGPQINEAA